MEVNIIFQNESKIDENNNFGVEFKNNQEILELFFNQKRDYYLTNAITFIRNNYDQKIKDLEDLAKKHIKENKQKEFKVSFPEDIGIDYGNDNLLGKYFKKYPYKLDKTKMELYKKKYKYFNTGTEKEDEFEVYDAMEHLKAGIVYKAVKKNTKDAYSEIGFKLTAGRKIEIKLARSTNQELRSYYYDWNNAIFIKVGDAWKKSNSRWIGQAERVKKSLKGRLQAQVDEFVGYYISLFFKTRPKELIMMNSDNYSTLTDAEKKFVVMAFYSNGCFNIHWPGYPYNI